jgi:Zn-dependent protease with chaperone function
MVMGTVPIYWATILVVMLIGSLIAIVRTIFSRSREVPPGRELLHNEAPELWALVEDVARKLTIQPVDTIYITPTTEIGVFEKGSILKKMRGTGERNLILGMGALSGLTQGQFVAILAHEYGHFSNRDTAGGNLAHQVYASLQQMAKRLVRSRANQIYNPAWLFVFLYLNIYLRVTQGASRLQEVLADRYAATTFGSSNFIEGLKNIVRQAIVFAVSANHEIQVSLKEKRPIVNLYELHVPREMVGELEKKTSEGMTRPTAKFDSHPSPQERIALIEQLQLPYSPMQENSLSTLRLFPNPEELEREMTTAITSKRKK